MRKHLAWFLCLAIPFYGEDQNPGIFLSSQDVPIFYEASPLSHMKSFMVITSCSLQDNVEQKILQQSIEKSLGKNGKVVHLKDNDMRGFGAGNILLIQIDNMKAWNGSSIPLSRLSLSIETSVNIDKTGVKTFPIVWSINSFLEEKVLQGSVANACQKLIADFFESYLYANQKEEKEPVFYIYD